MAEKKWFKSTIRTKSAHSRTCTLGRLIDLIEKHGGSNSLDLAAHTKVSYQQPLL